MRSPVRRGSQSWTSVPPPGGCVDRRAAAPMSIARSRMPRMPCDDGSAPGAQAAPVVADGQHDPLAVALESQLDPRRLGVAGDVGQRLLRDAVDHELLLAGERQAAGSSRRSTRTCACSAERVRQRGQRALQPELLERLRSQPARDPAHLLGAVRARSRAARRAARAAPRGSRAARPSTCSITPVSVWPTSSCSSRAIRRRSPSWTISACRALSRRSDSSRSSISLNVCASAATSGAAVDARPLARRQRIVPAHRLGQLVERAKRRTQQHQIEPQQHEQADHQHDQLGERHRHGNGDRREDQRKSRDGQHQRIRAEDSPEQRQRAHTPEHGTKDLTGVSIRPHRNSADRRAAHAKPPGRRRLQTARPQPPARLRARGADGPDRSAARPARCRRTVRP